MIAAHTAFTQVEAFMKNEKEYLRHYLEKQCPSEQQMSARATDPCTY